MNCKPHFRNTEHPEATQHMKVNWRLETTGKKTPAEEVMPLLLAFPYVVRYNI